MNILNIFHSAQLDFKLDSLLCALHEIICWFCEWNLERFKRLQNVR